MKTFRYVMKDEVGIHARPAGQLVKEAKKYESEIVIHFKEKCANAEKLMELLMLGVKCGDAIEVTVNGRDEERAFAEIQQFFEREM